MNVSAISQANLEILLSFSERKKGQLSASHRLGSSLDLWEY